MPGGLRAPDDNGYTPVYIALSALFACLLRLAAPQEASVCNGALMARAPWLNLDGHTHEPTPPRLGSIRPLKNYLGFGFLRRSTSCIHAVVRWQYCVKNGLACEPSQNAHL